ncbi:MAG: hypothetical protein QM642_02570 [Edaphocola sp.]
MIKINTGKIFNFSKLLGSTFVVQGLVQALGMLVGFYIVRKLSVQEYAYYTIANTVLGMMSVISDCGISTSVYSQGAKVWQDRKKLGAVVHTGIAFRNKFALIAVAISLPVLAYMLHRQGAGIFTIIVISLALLPAFVATLTDSLYEVVPKLHQELKVLQTNQVWVALLRLFIAGVALFVFPFTWIALLSNGLPRIFGNMKLRGIVKKNADITQPEDVNVKKETIRIVKRMAPGAIYYALSGQISLLILSFVGKSANIAEWGALGRYSVVFTLFTTVIHMVLVPRYSRKHNTYSALLKTSHQILFVTISLVAVVIILGNYESDFLLSLLGKKYKGINHALLLVMISGGISCVYNILYNLYHCKGWIIHPVLDLLINIVPVIFFAIILPLRNLTEVLIYNIYIQIFYFISFYIILNHQIYFQTREKI